VDKVKQNLNIKYFNGIVPCKNESSAKRKMTDNIENVENSGLYEKAEIRRIRKMINTNKAE
jgi:hypothetical protein